MIYVSCSHWGLFEYDSIWHFGSFLSIENRIEWEAEYMGYQCTLEPFPEGWEASC
jgi:hypothetical protein